MPVSLTHRLAGFPIALKANEITPQQTDRVKCPCHSSQSKRPCLQRNFNGATAPFQTVPLNPVALTAGGSAKAIREAGARVMEDDD